MKNTESSNTPINLCNTPKDSLNLAVKRRLDKLKTTPLTPHDVISKHMANSQSRFDNIENKQVEITEKQNTDITIVSNHLKDILKN